MQYFRPENQFFVGDCMPFSHDGVFHLFYLLDENHHASLGGLGGHQWAHASSRDLVRWEHHPLALRIEHDWERSICTGSVFFHDGRYHAMFATRKQDWTQHLGHAISDDCFHFRKVEPNPFASAPAGYSPTDLRDPFLYQDAAGQFQMLVTARLSPFALHDRGGCLLKFSSDDLYTWSVREPVLIPGGTRGAASTPECPDLFEWNGWHYLLFGLDLQTHYRMSRSVNGPWIRPRVDTLDNGMNAVMKTAAFGRRRIAVGWLGSRADDRDEGGRIWGGRAVFRELVQNADGTLGTRFVPEMVRLADGVDARPFIALTQGATQTPNSISLDTAVIRPPCADAVAALSELPLEYHLKCTVDIGNDASPMIPASFGLAFRGAGQFENGYELRVNPARGTVSLRGQTISLPNADAKTHQLEIIVREELIDVCIDGRACVIDACRELSGDRLFFFCEDGAVRFTDVQLHKLPPLES